MLDDRRSTRSSPAALDQPPEEWSSYLQAASADPLLRAEVENLLRLASEPQEGIDPEALADGPLLRQIDLDLAATSNPQSGREIGAWRILDEIGRGGMGIVYRVERAVGEFEQTAALKLIRPGLDEEEILRRFERERQILASLAHPNIARLLDGGRAEDGRPFLVLEHVEGQPIDRYCDSERLTIEQRLALFVEVARAVQHAHQSLIVHRDLKPSNIVVTPEGAVKLLDFGIARILDQEGTPAQPLTRTLARVLTPEYASPEQVLGVPTTTASDVYQLGLVLYELLTGQRAHRIESSVPSALERAVCEISAVPPSAAVMLDSGAAACQARRSTPAALARQLRGDLDAIVLTALRKEPERRYQTVSALVADVERFLAGRPVLARGDSWGYRTDKFVRRHRLIVGAASLVLASLVAGLAGTAWQAREASRERDRARLQTSRAERVTEVLVGVFETSLPERAQGREISARELLDRGARRIELELAGEPELQSALFDATGRVYRSLGHYDEAVPLLQRAVAAQRELPSAEPQTLAATVLHLAQALHDRGELAAAEPLYREALELRRRAHGPIHDEVAESLGQLGLLLQWKADLGGAEDLFQQALAMRRRLHGDEHATVAESLAMLGKLYFQQRRLDEAEPLQRQALAIRERLLGSRHPAVATSLNDLGSLLQNRGRFEAAEDYYRRALALKQEVLGPRHPDTVWQVNNLATLLHQRGDYAAAEPLFRDTLEAGRATLGNDHPYIATYLMNLGACLRHLDRLDEAAALMREAIAIRTALYGEEHSSLIATHYTYGLIERDRGHPTEAMAALQRALTMSRQSLEPSDPLLANVLVKVGELLGDAGRDDQAEPLIREGLELRRQRLGDGDWQTALAKSELGESPRPSRPARRGEGAAHRGSGDARRASTRRELHGARRGAIGPHTS